MPFSRLITTLFFALLISGCSQIFCSDKTAEIAAIKAEATDKVAAFRANMAFQEEQSGAWRGCAFAFNTCPESTVATGKLAVENGYTGAASWWFYAFVFAKASLFAAAAAIFISICFWLPRHLFVLFTKTKQDDIDAANLLIGDAKTQANLSISRRHEEERLTKLVESTRAKAEKDNIFQATKLADTLESVRSAEANLIELEKKNADQKAMNAAFKNF